MPFADRFATVQGRRTGYVDEGPRDGFPVLLLHGGGFDHAELTWRLTVRDLRHRLRMVVPDLPGYGESEGFDGPHSLADLGAWLVDFMDVVGIAQADVAGVSMGGGMALWVALEHPDRIRRVVPVGAYGLTDRLPFHAISARAARAGVLGLVYAAAKNSTLARIGLGASYGNRLRVTDTAVAELRAVARDQARRRTFDGFLAAELTPEGLRGDLTARLPGLQQPVLFIHGSADRVVPLRHARSAAALIPDARLEVMETGHWPMRERADLFNPMLLRFLTVQGVPARDAGTVATKT